ncbi:MAG: hypothetical protein HY22_01400 [[Candidatus Thermochlorobacteriaceae] bacterium GBChlB]|nr:MAG: hypothetical protein HY22_01400 [[Candidatus Thermochlorobacteriaceae] bacterium GBChlB]
MRNDVLFYEIFKTYPQIFFDVVEETRDGRNYQFSSVELKESSFRLDGVLVSTKPNEPIYFTEIQSQKDEKLYARLFAEIGLYLYQNAVERDWIAVVIYPSSSLEAPISNAHRFLLEMGKVKQIYLNELPDLENLSLGVALVKLIVEPEKNAVEKARRLLERAKADNQNPLHQQGFPALIETLILYKFSNKTREEVREMLGLSETLREGFRGTVLYNDIRQEVEKEVKEAALMKGMEEGMKEGMKEGIKEGLKAGKLEAVPLLAKAGYSAEEIARSLGLSIDDVTAAMGNGK